MATENLLYHFNYTRLDSFLNNDYDPIEIGDQLDRIRDRLVYLVHYEEAYRESLLEDYNMLGELRDILWKLSKA